MKEDLTNDTFEIIDRMYNHLRTQKYDSEILNILIKAAQALQKNIPPQIVAVKTVNGITLISLSKKLTFDTETNDDINKLRPIARSGGYKWSGAGSQDLRSQF